MYSNSQPAAAPSTHPARAVDLSPELKQAALKTDGRRKTLELRAALPIRRVFVACTGSWCEENARGS